MRGSHPEILSTPVIRLKCKWRTGEVETPVRLGTSPPAFLAGGTDLAPYRFGATGGPHRPPQRKCRAVFWDNPARIVSKHEYRELPPS